MSDYPTHNYRSELQAAEEDRRESAAMCSRLRIQCNGLRAEIAAARQRIEHLERFKALTHERLDGIGVDQCDGEDCRVGARFDCLIQRIAELEAALWPFARFSCEDELKPGETCDCHNCQARRLVPSKPEGVTDV